MPADDAWIRDGGRTCLDFVNTLRDRWDVPRETLRTPPDLVRWLRGAGLLAARARAGGASASALRSAVALREAVDRAVLDAAGGGLPDPADVDVINEASAASPCACPPVRLVVGRGRLEPDGAVRRAEDVAAGLGLVARDAIGLLLSPEVRRVRVCGSERCALRFLDRSPARNRRWCSMARCGNRTKARLHQARSRAPR